MRASQSRDYSNYYEEEIMEEMARRNSRADLEGYLGRACVRISAQTGRGRFSDKIDSTAERLNASGFHRHAIVSAVTAIELILRSCSFARSSAAFLSEEFADLLTHRIAAGRTADDRKLPRF